MLKSFVASLVLCCVVIPAHMTFADCPVTNTSRELKNRAINFYETVSESSTGRRFKSRAKKMRKKANKLHRTILKKGPCSDKATAHFKKFRRIYHQVRERLIDSEDFAQPIRSDFWKVKQSYRRLRRNFLLVCGVRRLPLIRRYYN